MRVFQSIVTSSLLSALAFQLPQRVAALNCAISSFKGSGQSVMNSARWPSNSFQWLPVSRSATTRYVSTYTDATEEVGARSAFGTRQYWDDMYAGQGDFPADEYSWYYGWETLKRYWVSYVPSKESNILLPGIGNDPMLLDLFRAGYKTLTAFDYSDHAVERQRDLLSYEPSAQDHVHLEQADARNLDAEWTNKFDAILEKGALDAIYLSGDGNVELAVKELERVLRPGGVLMSVSGVVPEELRRKLFRDWKWLRDGSDDLKAGCFILQKSDTS